MSAENLSVKVSDWTPEDGPPSNSPVGTVYFDPSPVQATMSWAAEFAKAQSEFGPIVRSKTVTVRPKDSSPYSFSYAPLEAVLAATLPALNKHGFSLMQREEGTDVVTTLLHSLGSRENRSPIAPAARPGAQARAASVTFARRYGVTLLLCVAAEDDNDANDADGNDFTHVVKQPTTKPTYEGRGGTWSITDKVYLDGLDARGEKPKKPDHSTPPPEDPDLLGKLEGVIADYLQEMIEAASEGSRSRIASIWADIRIHEHNEYVATEFWRRLKLANKDLFRTVSDVLKPAKGAK